jgi:hypothetical protein
VLTRRLSDDIIVQSYASDFDACTLLARFFDPKFSPDKQKATSAGG